MARAGSTTGNNGTRTLSSDDSGYHRVDTSLSKSFQRPLLRRQVEQSASRDLVLHALAKKVKTYQECNVFERLLEDLTPVGSIPRLVEGVMRQIVDFAIRIHRLINDVDSPYCDDEQPHVPDLDEFDDALLTGVCKYYYAHRHHQHAWKPDAILDYVKTSADHNLQSNDTRIKAQRWPTRVKIMKRTRTSVAKCQKHRVAGVLAACVCGKKLPAELVEVVREDLFSDDEIKTALGWRGNVIFAEMDEFGEGGGDDDSGAA